MLLFVLFAGFAITCGFDMGVATIMLYVARNEGEKRIVLNSVGPWWEGNQTWLILGAGAIFAAWPVVYATAFSTMHSPIMLVLFALILRPVAFDYRSKIENKRWKGVWDLCVFIGGIVPSLGFGFVVGNIFTGIPFTYDNMMRLHSDTNFISFFSPISIGASIVSLTMFLNQGMAFIVIRTGETLVSRARNGMLLVTPIAIFSLLCSFFVAAVMEGYVIKHKGLMLGWDHNNIIKINGGWIENYLDYPILWAFPVLTIALMLLFWILAYCKTYRPLIIINSLNMLLIGCTVASALFPFVLPSSLSPSNSITIWNGSSSYHALAVMFLMVAVFVPIILSYTIFSYWTMRGRVLDVDVAKNSKFLY